MSYFMISVDTEAWTPNNFEVEAATSGAALSRVLTELDAIRTERVLHSIHVGPAYDAPILDEEIAAWPVEDHFKRLSAEEGLT